MVSTLSQDLDISGCCFAFGTSWPRWKCTVSNLHDEEHYVLWAKVENQKSPESSSFPSRHIYAVRPVWVPRPVQRRSSNEREGGLEEQWVHAGIQLCLSSVKSKLSLYPHWSTYGYWRSSKTLEFQWGVFKVWKVHTVWMKCLKLLEIYKKNSITFIINHKLNE